MSSEDKEVVWWLRMKRAMVNTRSSLQVEKGTEMFIEEEHLEDDDMVRSESRSKLIRL